MENPFEIVAVFETPHEAELARGVLHNADIEAFIRDGHMVEANPLISNAVGGVKLAVRAEDATKAREILKKSAASQNEDEGWGACPSCGGRQLELRVDRRRTALTWLLLGIPLLFPRSRFFCRSCGALSDRDKLK